MTEVASAKSSEIFERIKKSIAGGESSYARLAHAPYPIVVEKGEGARFYDVDGNEYIDYCLCYGPLMFGHRPKNVLDAVVDQISNRGYNFTFPHELDYKVGEGIKALVPSVDLVRFANSGTEAVMAALRLARAYSGKDKIVRFEGHYHGWSDVIYGGYHPALSVAGLENNPRCIPESPGVPMSAVADLIVQPWNNPEVLARTIKERKHEIAAVLMEPIMSNTGVIPPKEGYLEFVRKLTQENGILLIFDEVISGFRMGPAGAQGYYNIKPDISTFAKALGAGFPVAAFGGSAEVMELEATNEVVHGGTYTASPLVLAAADVVVTELRENGDKIYGHLYNIGKKLIDGLTEIGRKAQVPVQVQGPGPMFQIFFADRPLTNYREVVQHADAKIYKAFQEAMQRRGAYFHPAHMERWFVSTAHTEKDIDVTLSRAEEAMFEIKGK